jgi:hypothetical protein
VPGQSLDERRFVQEAAARKRDLDLREREVAAIERPGWSSPIVLAILAAAFGLVGNVFVAEVNDNTSQHVERERLQSNLVLEAIRTGHVDTACSNLVFFVSLGLLDDTNRSVSKTCAAYPAGPPVLPTSTVNASPVLPLQSGIYVDVANAAYGFEMTGPGQLPNGVGKWIIRLATGINADCGIPATIYTGPINAGPLAARLSAAKITSSEYSYGVIDNGGYGACGGLAWSQNYLIGVSQVGNQVEIALFTYNGADHNIAGARVNYVFSKKI